MNFTQKSQWILHKKGQQITIVGKEQIEKDKQRWDYSMDCGRAGKDFVSG